ncbi:MAG: folate family ECF transporter S component [Clostridia bacterium]|nr:folate family ECF transporter S component [Clostridia bacterium]
MDLRRKLDGMRPWKRRLVWMTLTAMLTAAYFVLDRFLVLYPVPSVKVTFAFLTVLAAAVWLGPVSAMLVGGLGDLLGSLLVAVGAPLPLLTVSAALEGLALGFLLYEKRGVRRRWPERWIRLVGALLAVALLLHLALNTYALARLFSPDAVLPYMIAALPLRAIKEACLLAVAIPAGAALMKTASYK